jgi:hypothetical protein
MIASPPMSRATPSYEGSLFHRPVKQKGPVYRAVRKLPGAESHCYH